MQKKLRIFFEVIIFIFGLSFGITIGLIGHISKEEKLSKKDFVYDCSFTKTYELVDSLKQLDDYALFKDANNNIKLIKINNDDLKVNNLYNITFTIKGTVKKELNIDDIINSLNDGNDNLKVEVNINLDKTNNIDENVCKYKF